MTYGSRFTGSRRFLAYLSLIGMCAAFSGCTDASGGKKLAPDQAQITGSLSAKGKPVAVDTVVTFESTEKGAMATGKVDSLGKFSLSAGDPAIGIPAGSYTVTFVPPSAPAPSPTTDQYKQMMMKGGNVAAPAKPASDIPDKFQSALTSTLKLSVKAGPNDFPINLDTVQ